MTGEREYPSRPFVGVGVVVWRGDSVLLVRRGRPPNQGGWSLPGGAQEVGETVFEAARREVIEETGLVVEVLGLADVVDMIRRDDEGRVRYHYTLVDVLAESATGDAVAGGDVDAVAWMRLGDVDRLDIWSETKRVIRRAHRLRVEWCTSDARDPGNAAKPGGDKSPGGQRS
ncbi:MAG: NUDIX hydrolase [Rhodospirillales bacterium]|nr:NUDIX hydrolase [Rhodospirillales bacterium]